MAVKVENTATVQGGAVDEPGPLSSKLLRFSSALHGVDTSAADDEAALLEDTPLVAVGDSVMVSFTLNPGAAVVDVTPVPPSSVSKPFDTLPADVTDLVVSAPGGGDGVAEKASHVELPFGTPAAASVRAFALAVLCSVSRVGRGSCVCVRVCACVRACVCVMALVC